jgi:hypothetical protein
MGAPLHCYAYAGQGWILEIWVGVSLSKVSMSWLRLQTPVDCIPNSFWMYTKCFITLICCGWAYGCTLTLLRPCRSGIDFRKIGVGLSLSDVLMTWSWIHTPINCIPHPYHIYAKCVSTLIWYAVDGHMGAPLHCYASAGWAEFQENWGRSELK